MLGEMRLCCNPHVAQTKIYGDARLVGCKSHVAHVGLFVRRLFKVIGADAEVLFKHEVVAVEVDRPVLVQA